MPRARMLADCPADRLFERLIKLEAFLQDDEKDDPHIALIRLSDDDGFDDLGDALALIVDLGRADPDTARIEDGVGASCDDEAAALGLYREIAMAPDALEALKIGRPIFRALGIISKKADGHRREGRGADELAGLANDTLAFVCVHLHVHPEPGALDLAAIDGAGWIAEDKTGDDIGAARDAREVHAFAD